MFAIGDEVRVKDEKPASATIEAGWISDLDYYLGKAGKIVQVYNDSVDVEFECDNQDWCFDNDWVVLNDVR